MSSLAPDFRAAATTFGVNVTNPASNAFAITSITIVAPSSSIGFSFQGAPTCGAVNTLLGTLGAHSSTAVQCTAGTGTGLPPGFSQVIALGTLEGPSVVSSAAPTQGTFTSLVIDSSGTGESVLGQLIRRGLDSPGHNHYCGSVERTRHYLHGWFIGNHSHCDSELW